VNGATEFALRRLVGNASTAPDAVILDGKFSFDIGCELILVIDGDAVCFSVAAASILAKVRRDCVMEKLDARYPGYGFAKHKGYGTALHRDIIMAHGPSPIHRRSFEPVKSLMERSALPACDK
jgi:ribonuclease HII